MAFDRNDPADLLALKTEVNTDPIAMGYNPTGSTPQLLSLLNEGANNVGGETTGETFTHRLIIEVTEPDDLTVGGQFSQGDLETVKSIMALSGTQDPDISWAETRWRQAHVGNNTTLANIDARIRTLSRAEVLFGEGTFISRDDWFAARDS